MTPQEQRQTALTTANESRSQLAALKRQLRTGEISIEDAMKEPVFADALLIDVVRFTRSCGLRRQGTLTVLGKQALRDNVNLMVTVGRASERSKAWVAEHGYRHWRPSS